MTPYEKVPARRSQWCVLIVPTNAASEFRTMTRVKVSSMTFGALGSFGPGLQPVGRPWDRRPARAEPRRHSVALMLGERRPVLRLDES
jgi:hypothetical protein